MLGCYQDRGKYSHTTLSKRFGGWNKALARGGLAISHSHEIAEAELFDNLERVWITLGRQPKRRDMVPPVSQFSDRPYVRRFTSWRKAIEAFVEFVNASPDSEALLPAAQKKERSHKTGRDPSLRLRFKVMRRDKFKCRHCGPSPANRPNVELHVDHVIPWSQGGETTLENLQTLCTDYNLGKLNLEEYARG